jgi:hypothetical protein
LISGYQRQEVKKGKETGGAMEEKKRGGKGKGGEK